MATRPLPPMSRGITPERLTAALQENAVLAQDVTITELETGQVGEGVGMMSELSRLTPTYDGPAGAAVMSGICSSATWTAWQASVSRTTDSTRPGTTTASTRSRRKLVTDAG